MNMKKLLYIIALACTAAACSNSEQPAGGGYPADGVVRISPSVAAPLTRAEEGTEFSGSRLSLGLFYGNNDKYNKASLWKKDADGNWNSSSQLLWKNAEDEVVVYAYVPDDGGSGYDQEAIIAPSGGIPSDQSAGLDDADWLWYSAKIKPGEVLGADGKLKVQMNHALLKLTVNLSFGDEFGDTAPEIKEVWLNGTMQKVYVYYKYENGGQIAIPTPQLPMDIKMHKASDNCYEAIFYPSTGQKKDGKMLTVILADGREYTLTLAEDLAFEKSSDGKTYLGGCAYSMSAQVGKNKVQMGTIKVAPWTDKSSAGDFYTDAAEYSEWDGSEIATAYAGGDGSEGNPYQIATAAQLALLAHEVVSKSSSYASTYFQLTGNIDLMSHEWAPIGCNDSYPFAGIFDGNGKTILNLNVSKGQYVGLFGVASGAEIKNLKIRNASVSSKVYGAGNVACSGIVAGYCKDGSISGCAVEGEVTGDCYVGGIVGWIQNGSISDCTAEVSCIAERGSYSASGGIAGLSESAIISDCTVRGEVKGTYMAGGFVGDMEEGGAIKRTQYDAPLYCYADVSLYGECASSSETKEKYYVGGLVGKCCRSSSATVSITRVNVLGKVSLPDGLNIYEGVVNLGGYFGYVDNASISSGDFLGSIEARTPANGTLNAGAFIGMLGAGVTASYCKYYSSKVGGLQVYGAKAEGADDSGLKITTFD